VCVCCLGVVHAPGQSTCRTLPPFCMHRSSQLSVGKSTWPRIHQSESYIRCLSRRIWSPSSTYFSIIAFVVLNLSESILISSRWATFEWTHEQASTSCLYASWSRAAEGDHLIMLEESSAGHHALTFQGRAPLISIISNLVNETLKGSTDAPKPPNGNRSNHVLWALTHRHWWGLYRNSKKTVNVQNHYRSRFKVKQCQILSRLLTFDLAHTAHWRAALSLLVMMLSCEHFGLSLLKRQNQSVRRMSALMHCWGKWSGRLGLERSCGTKRCNFFQEGVRHTKKGGACLWAWSCCVIFAAFHILCHNPPRNIWNHISVYKSNYCSEQITSNYPILIRFLTLTWGYFRVTLKLLINYLHLTWSYIVVKEWLVQLGWHFNHFSGTENCYNCYNRKSVYIY